MPCARFRAAPGIPIRGQMHGSGKKIFVKKPNPLASEKGEKIKNLLPQNYDPPGKPSLAPYPSKPTPLFFNKKFICRCKPSFTRRTAHVRQRCAVNSLAARKIFVFNLLRIASAKQLNTKNNCRGIAPANAIKYLFPVRKFQVKKVIFLRKNILKVRSFIYSLEWISVVVVIQEPKLYW